MTLHHVGVSVKEYSSDDAVWYISFSSRMLGVQYVISDPLPNVSGCSVICLRILSRIALDLVTEVGSLLVFDLVITNHSQEDGLR